MFTNGDAQVLGRVSVAAFNNPSGLRRQGENMFVQSEASGQPVVGEALLRLEAQQSPTLTVCTGDIVQWAEKQASWDAAKDFFSRFQQANLLHMKVLRWLPQGYFEYFYMKGQVL